MNSSREDRDKNFEDKFLSRRRRFGKRGFLKIPLIIIFVLAKAGVVMLLWNALIPDIFHGPELAYLQALGLLILAKLFVGFGGGFRGFKGRHHWHHHHRHMHKSLSPEEREKLREKLRERWGR